jgi:hypothetical protein
MLCTSSIFSPSWSIMLDLLHCNVYDDHKFSLTDIKLQFIKLNPSPTKHLNQGSAEKESRKIYSFEKSHNFHGKLDFLNFGKSKM